MLRALLCLFLSFEAGICAAQVTSSFKDRIFFYDSLSRITEERTGYVKEPWTGGKSGQCTVSPVHGVAWKDPVSGTIEKVTSQEDSGETRQTLYLSEGRLYKVLFNGMPYYQVDNRYYKRNGMIENDTLLLRQFYQDSANIELLKKIL